jgi:hypothetical protein
MTRESERMTRRREALIGAIAIVASRGSFAQSSDIGRLQAWAMRTGAPAFLPSGYPLDHTAVVGVTASKQWGCFGRTAAEGGAENRMIEEAAGDELWAAEIAGPDGLAGLEQNVTGACQQCSNRILLPAGIDVNKARGNEIALPLFGKYGLGIPELVTRIKDGAHVVNRLHPNRISESQIESAVNSVSSNNTEEWRVVASYLEAMFKPQLGAAWPDCEADLSLVYLSLYNYREVLFRQYSKGRISKTDFVGRLQVALTGAVQLVGEIVKPVIGRNLFMIPAADLAGAFLNNR